MRIPRKKKKEAKKKLLKQQMFFKAVVIRKCTIERDINTKKWGCWAELIKPIKQVNLSTVFELTTHPEK